MGMNSHRSLPYPMSEVICEDWTHLKRLGVEGATVQCWSTNHSVYALNNLAFARCGWSDQVDHAEVLDDYLLGAFGSAGESVRPIFAGMVEAVRELARGKQDMRPDPEHIRYFLDKIGRDNDRQGARVRAGEAENDRERRQVEKLSAAIVYWKAAADMIDRKSEANSSGQNRSESRAGRPRRHARRQWPEFEKTIEWSQAPAGSASPRPTNGRRREAMRRRCGRSCALWRSDEDVGGRVCTYSHLDPDIDFWAADQVFLATDAIYPSRMFSRRREIPCVAKMSCSLFRDIHEQGALRGGELEFIAMCLPTSTAILREIGMAPIAVGGRHHRRSVKAKGSGVMS